MQVITQKSAEQRLNTAVEQGYRMFGELVAAKFYNQVMAQIHLLASNPHLGAHEPLLCARRRLYRSLVVHEHFKLIYYIDEKKQHLYIADLWDTRREPCTLAARIKSK